VLVPLPVFVETGEVTSAFSQELMLKKVIGLAISSKKNVRFMVVILSEKFDLVAGLKIVYNKVRIQHRRAFGML
jgi:hypothetical protein